jgi:hypothetical protein
MAFAVEGMPGELDIFETPVVQSAIIGGNWYQYKPTSSIADAAQLEFRVPGTGDQYVDLARTLFNVKIQLVKDDGSAFDAADVVGPVNNLFDTMWSDIKVDFNQKQVSDSRNMYHYRAYFEDLFNFNNTAKDSHQTASLWVQDTPGKMDNYNAEAFKARMKICEKSGVVDLAGKLHCDMFNSSKFLLNDIDIRFMFVKNLPEHCVMKLETVVGGAKLKIVDATLWIRKVKISPSILLAHANSLSRHTAKYPYKRVEMHNYTLPKGSQQHTLENMFLGRIPCRVMIGFVNHGAFSGDYVLNAFNFQHFNVSQLSLFKNGEQVFCRPYATVYGDNNPSYAIPYLQSFINTGNHLADDGYCVSMQDWQKGYCIYPFDLTPDLSAHEQHWCVQEQGNVRFEVSFRIPLPDAVTVICYAEFREIMEVDNNRECAFQFFK